MVQLKPKISEPHLEQTERHRRRSVPGSNILFTYISIITSKCIVILVYLFLHFDNKDRPYRRKTDKTDRETDRRDRQAERQTDI